MQNDFDQMSKQQKIHVKACKEVEAVLIKVSLNNKTSKSCVPESTSVASETVLEFGPG